MRKHVQVKVTFFREGFSADLASEGFFVRMFNTNVNIEFRLNHKTLVTQRTFKRLETRMPIHMSLEEVRIGALFITNRASDY